MAPEPFFIGWESEAAPPIRQFVKKSCLALLALGLIVAALTTAMQQTTGPGSFDVGRVREFTGILLKDPVPVLISDEPVQGERTFYLVSLLKHGLANETAERFHLHQVKVKGTLIADGLDAMIEIIDGGISSLAAGKPNPVTPSASRPATIRGEIVDSKCHLGVMNPGRFKPHRACAIRCIKGGIPPILVAHDRAGNLAHYLLVGTKGEALNDRLLTYIAAPVEVAGTLRQIGDLNVLYMDPDTIERL